MCSSSTHGLHFKDKETEVPCPGHGPRADEWRLLDRDVHLTPSPGLFTMYLLLLREYEMSGVKTSSTEKGSTFHPHMLQS